jgi:nucleoid-associated protein YgaU
MGIFDFVKDAGEKVLKREETEAAAAEAEEGRAELRKGRQIQRFVQEMGLPAEDVEVRFDDGVATVTGKAESTKVRQNIVLAIGNIEGVARVDDRMEVERTEPEAALYTVQKGDTLSAIAKAHYGEAGRYREIFEANRPMLKDPDLIYPGQVLRIPPG